MTSVPAPADARAIGSFGPIAPPRALVAEPLGAQLADARLRDEDEFGALARRQFDAGDGDSGT